jgi:AP-1 complex subunit beta-1
LDALAQYRPMDSKEAENIVERVLAQLSHANAGVVLSAVKVILKMFDHIEDPDYITAQSKVKLAPALVTLLSTSECEVQYVVLRNIIIVLQKMPTLMAEKDIRVRRQ